MSCTLLLDQRYQVVPELDVLMMMMMHAAALATSRRVHATVA